MRLFSFAFQAVFLTVSFSGLQADTLHVRAPFSTIQFAVNAAEDGDTVLVADGTYTGWGNRDIDFHGKAIVVMSENGPDSAIIDCQASSNDQHRGFIFQNGEDSTSVLEGFTIRNGYSFDGGGIYIEDSSPKITGNVIENNTGGYNGGGIYCHNSDAIIRGNTIRDNIGWRGGGMYCGSGAPLVENNTVSENYAAHYTSGNGGGLYLDSSSGEFIGNTIIDNQAQRDGGGVYVSHGAYLEGNLILNNWANWGRDYNGEGGGVFSEPYGEIILINNIIAGNTVKTNLEWELHYGGGIKCSAGYLEGNTIANNRILGGDTSGGGLACGSSTIVNNCIFWGNNAADDKQIHGNPDVTYSNVQDGWDGEGNINEDARFSDDYHLESNSPCINAGDPDYVPEPGETDIDGENRIMGGRIDMGADEFSFPHSILPAQW